MKIKQINEKIGAEVLDVDIRRISDDEFAQIYQTFIDNNCLVVRGQDLTEDAFLAYSRRFGPLKPHEAVKSRHAQWPELTVMVAEPEKMRRADGSLPLMRGEGWHTDTPYWEKPSKATQLYGVEVPSVGGDTLIANACAAYEALPDRLKTRIEGMRARFLYRGKMGDVGGFLEGTEKPPPVEHAVVATHPETGRRSLYVNPVHTLQIVGLSEEESDALLEELYSYLIQPGAEYRHEWQVGDILIWDNRSSIHSATGGYMERREMWRVTIL